MNLDQFDKDFEAAESSAKNIDLPEGKYVAELADGEIFESKEGAIPYLKLALKVVEGELRGTTVNKLYKLDDPSKYKWLKGDLATCGIMVTKISALPEMLPKAFGVKLNIQAKKNGQYTNYYINSRVGAAVPATGSSEVPF